MYTLFSPMFIDTHCHLNFPNFTSSLDEVIDRAKSVGVAKIIDIACEKEAWNRSLEISKKYKDIYSSLGIHPHNCYEWDADAIEFITNNISSNSKIKAIGEIGLDYFYLDKNRDIEEQKSLQKDVFIGQLNLARDFGMPVIIHTRDAEEDTIDILSKYKDLRLVIHCFSGTSEFADQVIDMGFYLSFTGMVTFPKMSWLIDIVRKVPEDKLMIETDSPYLAPVPMRGKDNEPANIMYTFKFLLNKLDESEGEFGYRLYNNSLRFFNIQKEA